MELRPEEDNPEEQCQDANPLCLAEHVGIETELRTKWFRGQGRQRPGGVLIWILALNLWLFYGYGIYWMKSPEQILAIDILSNIERAARNVRGIESIQIIDIGSPVY